MLSRPEMLQCAEKIPEGATSKRWASLASELGTITLSLQSNLFIFYYLLAFSLNN